MFRVLLAAVLFVPGAVRAEEPAKVAFTYHERCIFVPVRCGEHRDLLFLVDTGASASAIDRATAKRLGLEPAGAVKVEGTAGVIETPTVRVPELAVGEARVAVVRATTQDLSKSLAPKGKRLDGILGADFLGQFAVTIDYQAKTIEFSQQAAVRRSTEVLPLTLDNRIPRVRGVLNGSLVVDVRIDTGASLFETKEVYVNVTEGTWEALRAVNPKLEPEKYFTGTGTGGQVKLAVARVGSFALGGVVIAKPYVIVQPKAGYFARPDAVGFVGNNLLEKLSPVTIDYPGKKLYLPVVRRESP